MKPWSYLLLGWLLVTSFPARAEEPMSVPSELVGTWTDTVEVFGPFRAQPRPRVASEDRQTVTVTIHADGSVSGRIGEAVFKNCTLARNRTWVGRNLNVKTDYIIHGGTLEGKVAPNDPGTNSKFTLPFNLENGTLQGTVMLLPKYPLTARLNLKKVKPRPAG